MSSNGCPNCNWNGLIVSNTCPNCGTPLSNLTHALANFSLEEYTHVRKASPAIKQPMMLDCSACKTSQSMGASKIPRFSPVVRVIGGILLIPSFLGFGSAVLLFLSAIVSTSGMPAARSDAEVIGQGIGFGILFITIVVIVVCSLVGGLLGWLLLQNRNVYRCFRCSFVLDRA